MNLSNLIETCRRYAVTKNYQRILSRLEEMTEAPKYSEGGYSLGENSQGILFGDWNGWGKYEGGQRVDDPETKDWKRMVDLLEKVADIEWSDVWDQCSECGGAVRTSGDCYGWQRCYVVLADCDLICRECAPAYADDILQELEGKHDKALTADLGIDPTKHGYKLAQKDFENGFHAGQDASPLVIARSLDKKGIERYLFNIDEVGQFDMSFSLYIHEEEWAKFEELKPKEIDGPSVSEGLRRGLQSASLAAATVPPGDGPVVVKVDVSTGTATAKRVSPQDFVEGKALD